MYIPGDKVVYTLINLKRNKRVSRDKLMRYAVTTRFLNCSADTMSCLLLIVTVMLFRCKKVCRYKSMR